MKFKDKVVIVTGSARGIGKSIAYAFADVGANVMVSDIAIEKAEVVVKELRSKGTQSQAFETDVSDEKQVGEMVEEIISEFGKIDILVNNAGIIKRGTIDNHSYKDWDKVVAVNLRGTYNCSKAAIPYMKEKEYGKIINISSIAGKIGDVASAPSYGPSKGGINALTKSLARELASYGINVNAVAPHAIETEMSSEWSEEKRKKIIADIPLKRLGQPEEVAYCVLFLASDKAGFITGEILDINGGFLMD